MLPRERPLQPILALTPNPDTARRLALVWGLEPRLGKQPDSLEAVTDDAPADLPGRDALPDIIVERTVHGPVVGRGKVGDKPVAVSRVYACRPSMRVVPLVSAPMSRARRSSPSPTR